mmetsp:Transcript_11531/g.34617  ORF Transcript_11531/g.34617 Transcript_11531/m.34617 type:complete len:491 (+) Transcript_11531:241-1713(+)
MDAGAEALDWQFLQCFGERTPGEEIQEADIISAVEFDGDGKHLATGDRGGRVVLFDRIESQPQRVGPDQRSPPQRLSQFEYRYLTEFQSHEPEFDYLKSLEIEEKINQVRWCHSCNSQLLLSTNDKTIKLWRVYEKKVISLSDFNVSEADRARYAATGRLGAGGSLPARPPGAEQWQQPLRLPGVAVTEMFWKARCQRTYAAAHTYHINSISVNSDQETFISADDLRVNLWNLNVNDQSFNVVDIKPANMEDLTEVITAAEFHPSHCSVFAFSSSKGCIRVADMRAAALCDNHAKAFEATEPQGNRSFFSEIISSVSDIKFAAGGRHILARDYMTLKLWDLNMESKPVAVYSIHENLRSQLCDLYENDCIFDKFDCCISGDGTRMATGSYSNLFKVTHATATGVDSLLEASRDPLRKRLQTPSSSVKTNRFGLSRGYMGKKSAAAAGVATAEDSQPPDFSAKLLHLAWHPGSHNLIAAAASNSLYMYCAR